MFENNIIVSNSHVDKNMEMKEVAIINALQDIEGLHINNLTEFNNYLEENNLGVFLLYRQIDLIKKPTFSNKIKLLTHPYQTTIVSGYRHIYIYNEDNELLVTTNSFGAFINLDSYIPARLAKDIAKSIGDGNQSDLMECLPRKIDYINDNDGILLSEFNIHKSHIDRYNHVNNAYYIEFALDAFKEDISFNRIRAEYKQSFKLGNSVKVYLNKDELELKTILLKNENNDLCAIIEFSKF